MAENTGFWKVGHMKIKRFEIANSSFEGFFIYFFFRFTSQVNEENDQISSNCRITKEHLDSAAVSVHRNTNGGIPEKSKNMTLVNGRL